MEPNFISQDILLLSKIHYRIFQPKRFEVVAVQDRNKELLIKRVVGLPGEVLEYRDDALYIDGELIEEDFPTEGFTADFNLLDFLNIEIIPEGYYFVIGDNRSRSSDSRNPMVGLISRDDFIGRVSFRLWRM
jgi:signal peptidase I